MLRLLHRRSPFFVLALLLAMALSACGEQEAFKAYERGQHALIRNRLQDAITQFDKALELDSSYAKAYLARGQIRWRQQQYEEALPDLNRAIELDPYLIWAFYLRGVSFIALERYEASLTDLDRFIASEQVETRDRVRAHRWRGIALLNMERPEDALTDFSACIRLEPDKAFHYRERAQVYEGMGRIEEAASDYAAFLARTNPASIEAREVQLRLDSLRTQP